jgi:hypothetical protein
MPALAFGPADDNHMVAEQRAEAEALESLEPLGLGQGLGVGDHLEG